MPIPGFPHTGNILGAGTDVETEYQITGTEYQGSPPPIIGVNVYLPKGSILHPSGFPTCTTATLEQFGPIKCPKGSAAGPIGKVVGFVTFGGERVEEEAELSRSTRRAAASSSSPTATRRCRWKSSPRASYINLNGAGGYGPELETIVPLVPSVPGAPYASVKSINGKFGSAYKKNGKTTTTAASPRRARRAASRSRPK